VGDATAEILVESEMIPGYLTGELKAEPGEVIVRCDGIDVCRFIDGALVAVACDHPSHGCHPRFREKYSRLHEIMAKLRSAVVTESGPCPKCSGAGWLPAESEEARRVVLLSLMVGMWRGIRFTPRSLQAMTGGAMMDAILMGHKPTGSSSTPGQEGCS